MLLVLALLAGIGVGTAGPAHAEDKKPWTIDTMSITAVAARDGAIRVSMAFDFNFRGDRGHGPYLTLPTRQAVRGDATRWRVLRYDDITSASPSGAPANQRVNTGSEGISIYVGDEGRWVNGVQSYVVTYTVRGIVNPNVAASNLDEISWSILGTGWKVPISNVTATVTGPVDSQRQECWFGRSFKNPCIASASGDSARYSVGKLAPGEGLQVVAGYPVGTFAGATPEYTRRASVETIFEPNPLSVGGGLIAAALGLLGAWAGRRRWFRDQAYRDVAPGLVGDAARVGPAPKVETAVRFTPPEGIVAVEGGSIIDGSVDNRDTSSAIVDLAVKGHLTIEEVDKKHYVLHRGPEPHEPQIYVDLHRSLFDDGADTLDLSEDRTTFAAAFKGLREGVASELVHRSWFQASPMAVRVAFIVVGLLLVAAGVVTVFLGGQFVASGFVGVGLLLAGVAVFLCSFGTPGRTADGWALAQQARGFELYLRTAEADQIRFEEGVDIFSRYLPWAMTFGCADRWARVFEELAARGVALAQPGWYVGPGTGFYAGYYTGLATNMSNFEGASAAASATDSSGGGSGFGGGGGVGGGGGGGW